MGLHTFPNSLENVTLLEATIWEKMPTCRKTSYGTIIWQINAKHWDRPWHRGAFRPLGSFIQIAESKKWSGLYRIMSRKNIDNDIPGPPAYFTRRRDGIPVPSLHRFMCGYNNLFLLRLSSKTLETGFNILNRVCWTNQKDDWAQQAGGGGGGGEGGTRAVASAAMGNQPHIYFSNVRGWHNRSGLFCLKWLWVTWIRAGLERSGAYMPITLCTT